MIFYFSATGNSKYAAQKLQEAFGGEMINIAEAVRKERFLYGTAQDEKVFFVLPVYFWNLPDIVLEFLRRMDFEGDGIIVRAVLTCGASMGGADRIFRNALTGKNCRVEDVYPLIMPDNCVVFFPIPDSEAQTAVLRRSDQEIGRIIGDVSRGEKKGRSSGAWKGLASKAGGAAYRKMKKTQKFWVKDSCFGCGLCQTICPQSVIVMEEGRPVWTKDRCTWCLGCINRCPAEAIQFGKRTEKRDRYIHPIWK